MISWSQARVQTSQHRRSTYIQSNLSRSDRESKSCCRPCPGVVIIIDMAWAMPGSCQGKVQVFSLYRARRDLLGHTATLSTTLPQRWLFIIPRTFLEDQERQEDSLSSLEMMLLAEGRQTRLWCLGLAVSASPCCWCTGESETLLELLAASLGLGHSSLLAGLTRPDFYFYRERGEDWDSGLCCM